MSEFGQKNPDGTVSVYSKDDVSGYINPTPIRTETWAKNQGQAAPASTSSTPSAINALTSALSGLGSAYAGMSGNIAPTALLGQENNLAIAGMQDATNRLGLSANLYGQQNQQVLAIMQQAYLRERDRLLSIPEMRNADERARAGIALDAATQLATATGWINPGDYNKIIAMQMKVLESTGDQEIANDFWGQNPELKAMYDKLTGQMGTNYDWLTKQIAAPLGGGAGGGASAADIANVRAQLQASGWPGGTDAEAIAAFLGIPSTASQTDLVARLRGGSTGGSTASAADIASIRAQLKVAGWPGGTDAEAVAAFLRTVNANDPGLQDLVKRLRG